MSELLCFIHMIQITDEANSEHVPGHVQKADGVTEAFVGSTSSKDKLQLNYLCKLALLVGVPHHPEKKNVLHEKRTVGSP